jgi:hypothetical protein
MFITVFTTALPLVYVQSNMNPVQALVTCSTSNTFHFNIIFQSTFRSSNWPLPFKFSSQNIIWAKRITPTRATYTANRIFLPLTTRSKRNSLRPHFPSSILCQMFSSGSCSQTPLTRVLPVMHKTVLHPYDKTQFCTFQFLYVLYRKREHKILLNWMACFALLQ